jgi:hypothetical protein
LYWTCGDCVFGQYLEVLWIVMRAVLVRVVVFPPVLGQVSSFCSEAPSSQGRHNLSYKQLIGLSRQSGDAVGSTDGAMAMIELVVVVVVMMKEGCGFARL